MRRNLSSAAHILSKDFQALPEFLLEYSSSFLYFLGLPSDVALALLLFAYSLNQIGFYHLRCLCQLSERRYENAARRHQAGSKKAASANHASLPSTVNFHFSKFLFLSRVLTPDCSAHPFLSLA